MYKRGENNRNNFILVFDYFEHDLFGLMANKVRFDLPVVRKIVQDLLKGLEHMHSRNILHRDLKSGFKKAQMFYLKKQEN